MVKISGILICFILSFSCSSEQFTSITYDESHTKIVDSGFENFKSTFNNVSAKEKNSLLFCLERYVDPYYSSSINYEKELYDWLVTVIIGEENINVKQSALDLLLWDSSRDADECELTDEGKLICPNGAI